MYKLCTVWYNIYIRFKDLNIQITEVKESESKKRKMDCKGVHEREYG